MNSQFEQQGWRFAYSAHQQRTSSLARSWSVVTHCILWTLRSAWRIRTASRQWKFAW